MGTDALFFNVMSRRPAPIEVTIRGERIVMRVFDFLESHKAKVLAQDCINELCELYINDSAAPLNVRLFAGAFERNADAWAALLSLACRKPNDWIYTLRDAEGILVSEAFWAVHIDFFFRIFFRAIAKRSRNTRHAAVAPIAFH